MLDQVEAWLRSNYVLEQGVKVKNLVGKALMAILMGGKDAL